MEVEHGQVYRWLCAPRTQSQCRGVPPRRRSRGKVWREYGALAYTECVADDVKPGQFTSFPQSVKLEPDETVVLAWIVYESREHRDRVNEQVMNDPRIANMDPKSMPFDTKRMFWGGFTVFVDI